MGGLSSNSECRFDGYVGDQRGSDLDLIGNRSGSGVAKLDSIGNRTGSVELQTANCSRRAKHANDQFSYQNSKSFCCSES